MQYELAKLTANYKEQPSELIARELILTATWNDLGDAIELDLTVQDPTEAWLEKDCIEKCTALLKAIKQEKTYQNLYAAPHGLVFDDFESNN
jgi:hypothetical protein